MSYQTQNPCFIKAFVQAGVLAQGLLQCLAVVAPRPRLGFVRVLAANHSSRHPALRIRRGKRATPDTSRISHGYRKKAILSRNSSLSGRTQKICGLSAWLREQKDGLLRIEYEIFCACDLRNIFFARDPEKTRLRPTGITISF